MNRSIRTLATATVGALTTPLAACGGGSSTTAPHVITADPTSPGARNVVSCAEALKSGRVMTKADDHACANGLTISFSEDCPDGTTARAAEDGHGRTFAVRVGHKPVALPKGYTFTDLQNACSK